MQDTGSMYPYCNVQNGENWCWVTAAKLVAYRYPYEREKGDYKIDKTEQTEMTRDIDTQTGFRPFYLGMKGEQYTADEMQCRIMEVASGEKIDGRYQGDDACKCKALEYTAAQRGYSEIHAHTLGRHDKNLLTDYGEELQGILENGIAFIGNYHFIHQPTLVHSVVCIPLQENQIYLYDPWDGYAAEFTVKQIFQTGFLTNRGAGVITWLQYLK